MRIIDSYVNYSYFGVLLARRLHWHHVRFRLLDDFFHGRSDLLRCGGEKCGLNPAPDFFADASPLDEVLNVLHDPPTRKALNPKVQRLRGT